MNTRTTVRLDEDLLREAKIRAAASGKTMSEILEDAIRTGFESTSLPAKRRYVVLPTFNGTGVQPGVDIYDSAGLLDILDGPEPPDEAHAPS